MAERRLHVTNGASAVGALRAAGIRGGALAWDDVLHDGPVPRLGAEALRAARARWLAGAFGVDGGDALASLERRDRALAGALADPGAEVVLWFEPDLYDQLQRLQILDRVRLGAAARVTEAEVPTYVAECTAEQLQDALADRGPVPDTALADAGAAWDALCHPDPTALAALLPRLPDGALRGAIRRLLEELPASGTGLARSERTALEALADGPRPAAEVFRAVQAAEAWRYLGDASFALVLRRLARGPRPLLVMDALGPPAVSAPEAEHRTFWRQTVALTEAGRDVLAGRADRVACVGLDRWLGGTHLMPASGWRWDGEGVRLGR